MTISDAGSIPAASTFPSLLFEKSARKGAFLYGMPAKNGVKKAGQKLVKSYPKDGQKLDKRWTNDSSQLTADSESYGVGISSVIARLGGPT
ncbi:MAG: hypothetical protein U9Q76_07800 [candidate division WOR-3 bacterium]|nr:hypothetical protein [candidate division WOR-3 bacterium]